ncbi:uncharacterized protein GLRG_07799 [Colletotrichum graminicola M1.001]|uniref:Uncharacterized protein n=1 Tax=Colletotrichum graminicola (strain M1.001 / M2 / FGSC 10212) TaxID=645133 RepID=E3QP67_COLGM|nr:uncharacterized protein GLRG_07799 [Colletotrichum graminicola M1.001]EFQ32655.1 hypothetical protein GLRG_07799 [Colletotrichum graminicola M1.001]
MAIGAHRSSLREDSMVAAGVPSIDIVDGWLAALTSLGLLGVILRMKFSIYPDFKVYAQQEEVRERLGLRPLFHYLSPARRARFLRGGWVAADMPTQDHNLAKVPIDEFPCRPHLSKNMREVLTQSAKNIDPDVSPHCRPRSDFVVLLTQFFKRIYLNGISKSVVGEAIVVYQGIDTKRDVVKAATREGLVYFLLLHVHNSPSR